MYKHLLVIIALMSVAFRLSAFDFEVEQQEGYSLYFTIVDDEDQLVELTYPGLIPSYWTGVAQPSGLLNLPDMVEYDGEEYQVVGIGERAFSGCGAITSVVFPETITYIGDYAFNQCTGLRGMVSIGVAIESVGRSAFYGCTGLTSLRFEAAHCRTFGGSRSTSVFGGCPNLTRIAFGPRVHSIPPFAFTSMDQLSGELQLPDSLQHIGEYAFAFCSGLRGTLRLPKGVDTVEAFAFLQCHSLTAIDLSEQLRSVGTRAFSQCIGVRSITAHALVPPTVADNAFAGVPQEASLEVPCISAAPYKGNATWAKVGRHKAYGPCTIDLHATISNPLGGSIVGAGSYKPGTEAILTAVCHAGYSFLGWADGAKENPRKIKVQDTTSYRAIIEPAKVEYRTEYVHDTTYMDGIKVVVEQYEINDVADPIESQKRITYNRDRRRIEVPIEKEDILNVALYNDAGQCLSTGLPRRGHINMRRLPTGYYVVRISTFDHEQALRFFHNKRRQK